jgi:hypothetical protein
MSSLTKRLIHNRYDDEEEEEGTFVKYLYFVGV